MGSGGGAPYCTPNPAMWILNENASRFHVSWINNLARQNLRLAPPDSGVCPSCGYTLPSGSTFCPQCGRSLSVRPASGDVYVPSKKRRNWLAGIVGIVVLFGLNLGFQLGYGGLVLAFVVPAIACLLLHQWERSRGLKTRMEVLCPVRCHGRARNSLRVHMGADPHRNLLRLAIPKNERAQVRPHGLSTESRRGHDSMSDQF